MIHEELTSYIRKELTRGIPRDVIRELLIVRGGWALSDIDHAFHSVEKTFVYTAPKKHTPIVSPVMTEEIEPEPMTKHSQIKKKKSNSIGWSIAALCIICIGGGIGYHYWTQAPVSTIATVVADALVKPSYTTTDITITSDDIDAFFPKQVSVNPPINTTLLPVSEPQPLTLHIITAYDTNSFRADISLIDTQTNHIATVALTNGALAVRFSNIAWWQSHDQRYGSVVENTWYAMSPSDSAVFGTAKIIQPFIHQVTTSDMSNLFVGIFPLPDDVDSTNNTVSRTGVRLSTAGRALMTLFGLSDVTDSEIASNPLTHDFVYWKGTLHSNGRLYPMQIHISNSQNIDMPTETPPSFITVFNTGTQNVVHASVMSLLINARIKINAYYALHHSYSGVCTAADGVADILKQITALVSPASVICQANSSQYQTSAQVGSGFICGDAVTAPHDSITTQTGYVCN